MTERWTNVEDLDIPSLSLGAAKCPYLVGGFGAWSDLYAHDGHCALLNHDLTTGKSTAYGFDCEIVTVWTCTVSVESATDGTKINTFP